MKKAVKLFSLLFAMMLILGLAPAALAEDAGGMPDWYPEDPSSFEFFHNDPSTPRVIDNADIFTDEEEADLTSLISDIITVCSADVVIYTDMTTYGLDVPIYAADFYDFNGYGMGDRYDGMLLFLLMDPADRQGWAVATGKYESLYTEDIANQLDDELYGYLGDGYYYLGVKDWILNIYTFYTKGIPFAPDWYPDDPDSFVRTNNASSPRVDDRSDVLTDAEEQSALSTIKSIRDKYGVDVAMVFAGNTYGMDRQDYAEKYYYYNGLGLGSDYDGVLAVIWTDSEEVNIVASGSAKQKLTEKNIKYLIDGVKDKTDSNKYGQGADRFLSYLETTLRTGRTPRTPMVWALRVVFSSIIALIVSSVIVSNLKSKMKTVRTAYSAGDFLVDSSLAVNAVADTYTHSTTTTVYSPIQKDTGSRGGGSSGHSSYSGGYHGSSGSSHSGSGRRF